MNKEEIIEKYTYQLDQDFNDFWENLIVDLELYLKERKITQEAYSALKTDLRPLQDKLITLKLVLDKENFYRELHQEGFKERCFPMFQT